MVEIEFYGEQEVSKKFSALLETYNDVGRWKSEDPDVRRRVFQDVEDQVADLLNELGRVLGYRLEQIKLLRGGYYPEAFSVRDVQEAEIREFIQQLKRGEKAVPIDVLDVRHPRKILEQARETNEVLSAAALDEVKQEGAR
ncbi:hypothetical protein Dshi_1697 [Dinoroseobacter shibae DFL 12 = DSM 16493]|uniref:DUF6680 domain-containing protein n=1 Tax=Dinoroseobacter shibae (strain DSM 16493 / NCIMB 14021 / DFL 12) TaxID=398580 RepID=A8LLR1_DINSH|nr:hypothetical protein Dshi_1697 [Dinoroseobacter shibae DFL 12 = DSM 16493]